MHTAWRSGCYQTHGMVLICGHFIQYGALLILLTLGLIDDAA